MASKKKNKIGAPKQRDMAHLQMILSGKAKSKKMGDRRTKRNRTRGARNRKAIKEQW